MAFYLDTNPSRPWVFKPVTVLSTKLVDGMFIKTNMGLLFYGVIFEHEHSELLEQQKSLVLMRQAIDIKEQELLQSISNDRIKPTK